MCLCPTYDGIETTEHFLLLCPSFEAERRSLLADVFDLIHPFGYVDLSNEVLLQLLLYGDKNLSFNLNKCILESTINYIHMTGRFGCVKQLTTKPTSFVVFICLRNYSFLYH